jgi:hypothetical protein
MRFGWLLLLIAAFAEAGCYGPVRDQSGISSTAVLGDGRVAIAYHQYRYRPAAGIAAYPDGGISKTVRDRFIVGVVGSDGTFHKLATYANEALPGSGSVSLRWFAADPQHLYATRAGQQTTSLPIRYLNQQVRLSLDGGDEQKFDLAKELQKQGRSFGAEGFGDYVALAPDGTLLVGATAGDKRELWLRSPSGALQRLASFDRFDRQGANYLFYSNMGPPFTTYALDWRTGEAHPVLRYNRENTQQEWRAIDDPAFDELNSTEPPTPSDGVTIGDDRRSIHYMRDGHELWSAKVEI